MLSPTLSTSVNLYRVRFPDVLLLAHVQRPAFLLERKTLVAHQRQRIEPDAVSRVPGPKRMIWLCFTADVAGSEPLLYETDGEGIKGERRVLALAHALFDEICKPTKAKF